MDKKNVLKKTQLSHVTLGCTYQEIVQQVYKNLHLPHLNIFPELKFGWTARLRRFIVGTYVCSKLKSPFLRLIENASEEVILQNIKRKSENYFMTQDIHGKNALFYCIDKGYCKLLLTILHILSSDSFVRMLECINKRNETPLIYSMKKRKYPLFNTLKLYTLNLNSKPYPIFEAIKLKSTYFTCSLLSLSIDKSVLNHKGRTPLMECILTSNPLTFQFLTFCNENDVNQTDSQHKSPLMYAIETKKIPITVALISMKANIHITDSNNKTPLDLAYASKNDVLINIIKNNI